MRSGILSLANAYDLVIIDTPPVSVCIDAVVLSSWADQTLFLVRWGRTKRPVVTLMLQDVAGPTGNLPVVALSMVDVRRHARYRFGDSGQYHGPARTYYS
jgi:Mrp family chromosome partitioning ATPase